MERIYACIDLKSFYASVECMERGLDPITTNLVVADKERTEKTRLAKKGERQVSEYEDTQSRNGVSMLEKNPYDIGKNIYIRRRSDR